MYAGRTVEPTVQQSEPPLESTSGTGLVTVIPASLSTVMIRSVVRDDGRIDPDNNELAAIATILKAHDLVAVIRVSVPRLTANDGGTATRRALRRIESVEAFFMERGVSEEAFRIVVEPALLSPGDLSVELEGAQLQAGEGQRVDS